MRSTGAAGIEGRFAELLRDADQLIVFGETIGARHEPVLICPTLVATARSAIVACSFRRSGAT